MRIAYLTIAFPCLSEQFMRREVVALLDRGHEVTVFTVRDPDPPRGEAVPGVEVRHWSDGEALACFAPDVLYASLGTPAHARAAHIADQASTPFVLRLWSGLDMFQYKSERLYRRITAMPKCRAVIVEDTFTADWAEREMGVVPAKLRIVPNSVDVDVWKPGEPTGSPPPYVLTVGRFVRKKGIDVLIRAMKEPEWFSVPHLQAVQLWIVGYGEQEPALRRLAGPNVRFLGQKPVGDLLDLYRGARVCVFPGVRTPEGDADGMTTTALEAMAVGRPVMVSDLLSASCYVDAFRGWLLPPGNVRALSVALRNALEYRMNSEARGVEARRWAVEHLDIRDNVVRLEECMQA
jgi:glycosyltransferase involved in cell wall biosynthesis